tara:strand:- start:66 stop:674 length:609 start_codon:yes stop_codon:yes gene_type:complete
MDMDKQYTKEKCENCGYKYNCYGLVGGHFICNRCYSLWYENIKLKEENEKLNQELLDYENGMGKYDFDPLLSQKQLCKIVEEWEIGNCHLHENIKQLKEENETLKEMVNKMKKEFVEPLMRENEKLKLENEAKTLFLPDGYEFFMEQGICMNDIIEKLQEVDLKNKEEIKELKKQFNNIINLIKTADTDEKIKLLKELDTLD